MREAPIIATYMTTNRKNGVIYTGVTDDLFRRSHEHKYGKYDGFTKRYNADRLVYYEVHNDIESAMHRERRLKKYMRAQKINLIEAQNPQWLDLYHVIKPFEGNGPIVAGATRAIHL